MNSFLWSYAIKDLFRQKTRTFFGILGIVVSLFLLTTVSFITDSVSYNFIDFLTLDAGNQDMVLYSRPHDTSETNFTSYFDYSDVIPQIRNSSSEIDKIIPRAYYYSYYLKENWSQENDIDSLWLCTLNVSYEENLNFGSFLNVEENLDLNQGIPVNSCIISTEFATRNNISVGASLSVFVGVLNATMNFTVLSTYENQLKFPIYQDPEIVVDLSWWGMEADKVKNHTFFGDDYSWNNKANRIILTLTNTEAIYDVRDVDQTEIDIANIGADVLTHLGIEDWEMSYPKLDLLFLSEFLTLTMNILFITIGIISMLISGILINAILSTSVEERIKEYGINRVLGARKLYNLKLILIQASLICTIGTTLGILFSGIFVRFGAIRIIESLLIDYGITTKIAFLIRPISILSSYLIGIGVSMAVSIVPALKVMKMKIVESINPYRTSDEVYHMEKEGSANVKLIIIGIILSVNAGFIYFLIPRIIISFQFGILASVLIITLLVFMIGVSLMAIGFMPLLIRFLVKAFEPFNQKLMNIVKITVHRHQRRNLSTTVMFVLSFSFIIFTTSMVEIQLKQVGGLIQYEEGADIIIRPKEYNLQTPTADFSNQLMEIPGIERVSNIMASANDLEHIYQEENKNFDVQMGDFINFQSQGIRVFGIDNNFADALYDQEFIVMSEGDQIQAFNAIFNESQINIIISAAIASDLRVHLGDVARLTFTRGTEEEPFICRVVGVAKSMPGTQGRFSESGIGSAFRRGGVLMSADNYIKCMNVPGGEDAYIDQIFVKVQSGYDHIEIANEIKEKFGTTYDINIDITSQGIDEAEESFLVVKYLFLGILIGTVLIALFGLIASSYSSILERKREIGILRTLGLYGKEVERMFLIENMILLLSSSTSGGIIGFLMALGLTENMTLFTQTPRIIAVPWDIIGIIYSVSIITLIIGMRILMRKLRYQNLIEIFRETL